MPTWRSKHRIRLKNRSGNIGKKQKKKRQKRKRQVPQQFRISFTLTPLGLFGISRKRPAISGAQHEGTEWATRTNAESSACHRCHVPLLPHSLAFCSSTLRYRPVIADQQSTYAHQTPSCSRGPCNKVPPSGTNAETLSG